MNVPPSHVETAAACIDHFYVDCKDTNPAIYRSYTGKDNGGMLQNLALLLSLVGKDRVTVRVPLIPEFNTEEDREATRKLLADLGVEKMDFFTYKR